MINIKNPRPPINSCMPISTGRNTPISIAKKPNTISIDAGLSATTLTISTNASNIPDTDVTSK